MAATGASIMFDAFAAFWNWLTTSRYTRLLEDELARLRLENTALRNSIYARAGVPPIEYADAVSRAARANGRTAPLRRTISWAQARARLEALHRRAPQSSDDVVAGPSRPSGS